MPVISLSSKVVLIFACGLRGCLFVRTVRCFGLRTARMFCLWTVQIFACGLCGLLHVDFVDFFMWSVRVLCLWIANALRGGCGVLLLMHYGEACARGLR